MKANTISVAMATYNGASFLPDQLQSIAEQTVLPDELVVSDDGSTDETLDVLKVFAKNAPFPVHVHPGSERLGYVRNFRRVAGLCTSDLISFADQDDWMRSDRLEVIKSAFEDSETLMAYHNARIVDNNRAGDALLHNRAQEEGQLSIRPLAPWHHGYGMTQSFRATLKRFDHLWDRSKSQNVEPVEILSHDHWYIFLALVFGKVRFIDQPLVDYRQHAQNQVGFDPGGRRSRSGMLGRWEHYGRKDERSVDAARSRAGILRAIAVEEPALAPRAEAVAAHYDKFAEKLQRRAGTFGRPTAAGRLASLLTGLTKGDYRDWPWGFDPKSVPRDLYSGVMLKQMYEPTA